jgi:hypothetical protein
LLNAHQVEYLLVGGYAVGYYGYPRATADMDLWVGAHPENAEKIVAVLKEFGFEAPELSSDLFLKEGQIVRMGVPPVRIEIMTSATGVDFNECYKKRKVSLLDGVEVSLISRKHLKDNKRACARHKDLDDLEHLP